MTTRKTGTRRNRMPITGPIIIQLRQPHKRRPWPLAPNHIRDVLEDLEVRAHGRGEGFEVLEELDGASD